MAKDGVIPSGSMSMNDVPVEPETTSTPNDKPTTTETSNKETKGVSDKSYEELKKLFDRQANELGMLRKEIQGTRQPDPRRSDAPKPPQTSDELGKVMEEYGALDFYNDESASKKGASLMKKAIGLTAKMVKEETLREADGAVRGILQEKDWDSMKNKFLESNPDFTDLQAQGVFQAMKGKNPLHDDFSAYHAHKAESAMAKVEELTKALEEAKKVANLAGGDHGTSKVLTKPGADLRAAQTNKPKTVAELKQSALAAIRRARGIG